MAGSDKLHSPAVLSQMYPLNRRQGVLPGKEKYPSLQGIEPLFFMLYNSR
jgi:hypothetical protein